MSAAHDPYARERAAATAGKRVQANRGSESAPNWVTLGGMPEFTCAPELYRVHPDDAAAPAASEGEDGAVATVCLRGERYGNGHFMEVQLQVEPGTKLPVGTKLYTRPAAQVAATPKHDEGLVRPMGEDARVPDDFRGWAAPAYRAGWNDRHAAALATQPAARRVTEEDVERAAQAIADVVGHRMAEKCEAQARAALESFAQPGYGVSR